LPEQPWRLAVHLGEVGDGLAIHLDRSVGASIAASTRRRFSE